MKISEETSFEELEEKINFRLKVEKTIGDISTYLVFSSNFEMAIKYFLSEIAELYHFYLVDGAIVCLFDEPVNNQTLVLEWSSDRIKSKGINFKGFPIEDLIWFQNQIKEGQELIFHEEFEFPPEAEAEIDFLKKLGVEMLIAFPIFTPEYLAGAFILVNILNYHTWQEEDIRTIRLFADILGTTVFRKKTEETLSKSRDYLKMQVERKTKDLTIEKRKIELILNTIKDGVLVLDEAGKVILTNDISRKLYYQIFNQELIIGTNLVLSTGNLFYDTVKELFLSEDPKEISIEPKSGLHLQFVSAKGTYPELASIGTIIEFRDVTPFIEFDNMRKQFVSTVSHELRTPITVITQSINNYEKYGDQLPENTKAKLFSAISRNAKLLHELIEDLLLVSRIDERRVKFHWQDYDIEQVLSDVIAQMEPRAKAKSIKISKSIKVETTLFGDPKRMAQIFRIILDNSMKYSHTGNIITINGSDDYKGEYNTNGVNGIILQFSDTGIGISEEDLPKLFDRFFRSKRVSHISGTGLGLGIARELVHLHKGEIFIESRLNYGTNVIVFLPRLNKEPSHEEKRVLIQQ